MLIRIRYLFVLLPLLIAFSFDCAATSEPYVSASSSVLLDADSLEILFGKDEKTARSMASTTKIMTTLLAVESGKLNDVVTVKDKLYIEGTAIGFDKGDKITLEVLCYGMLLESGNDAAVLTANYLAGSEEKFSILMNKKAREIGMFDTCFVTASGLDDKNHYTTAYDMALLGAYAVKNEDFRRICSSKTYKADFIKPDISRTFSNHNRLLNSCEGVFGIKTGFTKKSGRCLVTACERNGKVLVAVTLNASDDWNDHRRLYEYGYSLYEFKDIQPEIKESVMVFGSQRTKISIDCNYEAKAFIRKGKKLEVKTEIQKNIYAPVKINDIIGKVILVCDGEIFAEYPIFSLENADVIASAKDYKPSFKERFIEFIHNFFE